MKTKSSILMLTCLLLPVVAAFGLSTPIGRDINFPKGFDPKKAAAIMAGNDITVEGDEAA